MIALKLEDIGKLIILKTLFSDNSLIFLFCTTSYKHITTGYWNIVEVRDVENSAKIIFYENISFIYTNTAFIA